MHATPELNNIRDLFRKGLHREVIEKTTLLLEAEAKPDPELLYWRGSSRKYCGLFEDAKKDLKPLGNVTGWKSFFTASQLVEGLDTLMQQRPPNEYDIKNGDKVMFRVYYGDDDQFFHTVVDALPQAYRAASSFIGLQGDEIPVFVFNSAHYQQFVKFYTTFNNGGEPQGWWRLLTHNGTISISQSNALEAPLPSNCPSMARLLSHEITHQLTRRIVGNLKDFPNWFSEGAAQCGEGVCDPRAYSQNDRRMRQLIQQNAILPLDQLVASTAFHNAVDQLKKGKQKGDAYAQAFSMTRYLGHLLHGKKLRSLLDDSEARQSFATTLKLQTGMSMDEFYQSWLRAITLTALTP